MEREKIMELLELSMDNRNEYRRKMGYGEFVILYDVVNKLSMEELEKTLREFEAKEKYYQRVYWNRND